MSKRFRFILVLALVGVSVYFLYPSIQWYFFVPESDRELAAGSRGDVREHAQAEARTALDELTSLAQSDETAPLPDEYAFLRDAARANYQLIDEDVPDEWTIAAVL